MIDQLLFTGALMAPELGAMAGKALTDWVKDVAKDVARETVHEMVSQTTTAVPTMLQSSFNSVTGALAPTLTTAVADVAQGILGKHLTGYTIVPSLVYEAQMGVISALKSGGDVQQALQHLIKVESAAK